MRHPVRPSRERDHDEPRFVRKDRESLIQRVLRTRPPALPRFTSGGIYTQANNVTNSPAAATYVVPASDSTVLDPASDPAFTQNSAGDNELKYNGWPQLMRLTLHGSIERVTGGATQTLHLAAIGKRNGSVPVHGDQIAASRARIDTLHQDLAVPFSVSCLAEVRDDDIISPLYQSFLTTDTILMVYVHLYATTVKELTA